MDGEPINLNKIRKAAERARKRRQADENAVKFGRTKAQRVLDAAQAEKMRAALDRQRFEGEDET